MRKWVLYMGLVVILAACNGGDKKDDDTNDQPPAGGDASQADATEDPFDSSFEQIPIEPGLKVQNGLTLLTYSLGMREGVAYFYGEVRNDTGESLRRVECWVYPVDADGYQLGNVNAEPLVVDIPAGQTVYVGRDYNIGDVYADAQVWLRYEKGEPQFQGFYGLPVTISYRGLGAEGMAYVVRGTAENTTGQDLQFHVIDVALIGPDENLVGLARGVLSTSAANGVWPAGETAEWEAPFFFTAVEPDQVRDVRVSAVGYTPVR